MVERERKVDKGFLGPAAKAGVIGLDNVVDLADRRSDKKRKDEGENIPVAGTEEDVDRVEETQNGEPPSDAVDDKLLATVSELEDQSAEEKEMDQRPHVKRLGVSTCTSELKGRLPLT